MIRKLSHHVGIVGVGKIKASVAVRQVLQRQFIFHLPKINSVFSPLSAGFCP